MTSYLLSLPNELLLSVVEHLVPEPLATGSSPELSRDYIQRRGTLRHLCLVCKRLCGIAQPLLFRNIAVTNGVQTVLLFRSLWNVPALRQCPWSFACPILLSEQDVVEDTLNCWNSNVDTLSRDPADPDIAHFLNSGYVQLRQVGVSLASGDARPVTLGGAHRWLEFSSELLPEILVGILLALQGQVRDVLLRTPEEGETAFDPFYLRDLSRFVRNHQEIPATRLAFSPTLLSTAKSLRLQGDTARDNHWHGVLPTYFPFWEFDCVTRLEYYRDAADWNEMLRHLDDEDPADNQALKRDTMTKAMHQIEELRFYSSRMAPWSMRQLLSHCPNLRSLHWAFGDNVEWLIPTLLDVRFYESDFEPQASSEATLDEALMAASGHLESLHLDVMIESTVRFDSRYRVTCLSAFTNLRHVTIDTVCLLGLRPYAMDPLEKNIGPLHLIDVLPPNLEKLVLIEKWYGHQIRLQECGPDYLVWWAEEHLWRFARQCRPRYAALQSIVYRASRRDTNDYYDFFPECDTTDEKFATVRALVGSLPM
ncbi:hypothetical protein DL770_000580 [Monosporascus sp. CRB-9-2]|nr:hypothetical protein DL770_000580 [Monosporascus sp. CRB-9-2]